MSKFVYSREDRLNWDDHHMLIAMVTSQRSPDPNTQVGACIVDHGNKVQGVGYNGYPRGIGMNRFSWARKHKNPCCTKYPFVVHAEKNAIYNSNSDIAGSKVYVTMYPCNECAKDIIQAGLREVIYLTNPYKDEWFTEAAKQMLEQVDVYTRQHEWDKDKTLSCLQKLSALIA